MAGVLVIQWDFDRRLGVTRPSRSVGLLLLECCSIVVMSHQVLLIACNQHVRDRSARNFTVASSGIIRSKGSVCREINFDSLRVQ